MKNEIYAVLVKVAGETLLLPNAAVIEVISAEGLRDADSGKHPAWLAGSIFYQERTLPVVRFEAMNGGSASGEARRARLTILQGVTDRLPGRRYALLCQGYPHLVTLNREAVKKEPAGAGDRGELVLSRVKIANTSALIPNLELIEAELGDLEAVQHTA